MDAQRRALLFLAVLGSMAAVSSCGRFKRTHHNDAAVVTPPSPPAVDEGSNQDGDAKHAGLVDPLDKVADLPADRVEWWYAKTARLLTGRELKSLPEAATLRAMPRRQFVEALTQRDAFADQMLIFNRRFLGLDGGKVRRDDGAFNYELLDAPAAIASAQALLTNGDYLQLFAGRQPLYLSGARQARLPDDDTRPSEGSSSGGSSEPELPQDEIRTQLRPMIRDAIAELSAIAENSVLNREGWCAAFGEQKIFDLLDDYGLPFEVRSQISLSWFFEMDLYCFMEGLPRPNLQPKIALVTAAIDTLLASVDSLSGQQYAPKSLAAIQSFDLQSIGVPQQLALTSDLFGKVTNSSTNFDRRRGAYILKRFFCDDLTPINQAIPASHAEGKHASDPSCVSCHYKLDPMAGFFKDAGIGGIDFSKAPTILFDDLAKVDHANYVSAWGAPEGSSRRWNIGYIRSIDDEALNTYGESLDDLFAIIRQAPEPKKCLVRRLFEFYNGEGQAIDPAWLEDVTQRFVAEASENSSVALRKAVARVVLGNTFSEPDPISTQCYDRLDTEDSAGPPCLVSHLLEKNCAACHGTGGAAGLDLTHWVAIADGKPGFAHVQDGAQVPRAETMQRIVERLASGDEGLRMPLGKFMPQDDREAIYLWAQKEAAR